MNPQALGKVKESLEKCLERLTRRVELRDEASIKARRAVKLCGEAISLTHRGRLAEAKSRVTEAKGVIGELKVCEVEVDALSVALQELVEAEALLSLLEEREIPSVEELEVTDEAYVLGLADLVGELRRMTLEYIRAGDGVKAEEAYEVMKNLYEMLWPLEYPRSLVPGLRHKVDVMRRILDETLHDLTLMKMLSRHIKPRC
ncbi:MAG: haloacid dehalogenase [Thermoprotei archaeon]|nr:MAG: haloacid dehalogenase [Thermoprotei archaeon]